MSNVLFKEEQRFDQWWLKLLIVCIMLVIAVSAFVEIGQSSDMIVTTATALSCLLGIVLMGSIFYMKLTTTITDEKIHIRYFPFLNREWKWSDIQTAKVIDYGFVGGWGIRIWTGMGTVYNVKGSKGLHFKTDSKEYVIGTQKEEELRSSVAHLLK
ncbi:hypothetical protein [Nonlabens agnitus]|uniref:Bacterial Pleckstrin homology domain-containing protein n=1 Tax=Nonlabens agnitus TaxID=870484 RepID=A0A2S9WUN9_9FLAO|nr:hypothetical protein [Nonlabens agnitus]PRP67198.1 hypothetical protein BST86_08845 [Nonlabens agnitus]